MTLPGPRTEVTIADCDPAWPALFAAERAILVAAAGAPVVGVHHVGSTAVPGLAAKPLIDVLIVLGRFFKGAEIAALAAAGFDYRGANGIPGRQYFERGGLSHVHAFLEGDPEVRRYLLFVAYLRDHPGRARQYAALKRRLADWFSGDRVAYTEAKTPFIRETDRRAAAWADREKRHRGPA